MENNIKKLYSYIKKTAVTVLMIALLSGLLCGITGLMSAEVSAAETEEGVSITVSSISDLKSALTSAQSATADNPYVITLEEGSYTLSTTLYIPSYTTLIATGATITQDEDYEGVMLRTGNDSADTASAEGYCYTDIIIDGGTWDMNGNAKTMVQICHAQNVIVQNATFQNIENGHLMEVAGVSGLTIYNCSFLDQLLTSTTKTTYEAIQIDILQEDHLIGYAQEDLGNEDISITYCVFNNVPRGVGSHTAILNCPVDGITVDHCTFNDVQSAAIQFMAVKNATITNNTITDAARGIFVYTYRTTGTFLGTTLNSDSSISTSCSTYSSNLNISNNTVTLNTEDDAYDDWQKAGILVQGLSLSSAEEGATGVTGNKIPAGNYYITGVTISNNVITTALHGIRLSDARGTTVSGNTINYIGTASAESYGIAVSDASKGVSSAISITGNTITNSSSSKKIYRGIFVTGSSTVANIKNNEIPATRDKGIFIYNSSSAKTISGNTIGSAGVNGIMLYSGSSATTISSNTITSPTKYGIDVDGSTVTTISSNTITSAGTHGIFVYNSGKVTTISKNTITSAKSNGIMVSGSTVTDITSNTIKSAGSRGIQIYKSTATNIKSNTITSPSGYGIMVTDSSKVSTISSNTISSAGSNGIHITSLKCALTISSNTVKTSAGYQIYLCPKTTSYTITVKSNTITGKSKKKVGVYATQCKVSLSSNTIKSCSYPVQFTTSVYGSIYATNTLSSNTYNKYKIGSKTSGNLSKPTLTMSTKKKTSLKMKWTKVSGTGYQIYRATSKSGTYSKKKTITSSSTLTWTNTGLTKSTTYYYKIRAYKTISNTKIYSSYSTVKSAKTTSK